MNIHNLCIFILYLYKQYYINPKSCKCYRLSTLPAISVKGVNTTKCDNFRCSEVFMRYRGWARSATAPSLSTPIPHNIEVHI